MSCAQLSTAGASKTLNADKNKDVLNTLPLLKTLESQLKITLPEDLGEALSNGTVLCQLVNHIRPRSVSIIHVPSPAVVSVLGPFGPKNTVG